MMHFTTVIVMPVINGNLVHLNRITVVILITCVMKYTNLFNLGSLFNFIHI